MPSAPAFLSFLGFGGGETMLVLLAALILFGGDRLPGFARGLGKAIREFKKATSGVEEQIKRALEEPVPVNRTVKPAQPVLPEKSVPSDPAKLPPPEAPTSVEPENPPLPPPRA